MKEGFIDREWRNPRDGRTPLKAHAEDKLSLIDILDRYSDSDRKFIGGIKTLLDALKQSFTLRIDDDLRIGECGFSAGIKDDIDFITDVARRARGEGLNCFPKAFARMDICAERLGERMAFANKHDLWHFGTVALDRMPSVIFREGFDIDYGLVPAPMTRFSNLRLLGQVHKQKMRKQMHFSKSRFMIGRDLLARGIRQGFERTCSSFRSNWNRAMNQWQAKFVEKHESIKELRERKVPIEEIWARLDKAWMDICEELNQGIDQQVINPEAPMLSDVFKVNILKTVCDSVDVAIDRLSSDRDAVIFDASVFAKMQDANRDAFEKWSLCDSGQAGADRSRKLLLYAKDLVTVELDKLKKAKDTFHRSNDYRDLANGIIVAPDVDGYQFPEAWIEHEKQVYKDTIRERMAKLEEEYLEAHQQLVAEHGEQFHRESEELYQLAENTLRKGLEGVHQKVEEDFEHIERVLVNMIAFGEQPSLFGL
jgi:hypothetical protein